MSVLLEQFIAAYGGRDRWNRARKVRAVVSADGLAFILKRRPPFQRANLIADVQYPRCSLTPIGGNAAVTGTLEGTATRLESASGKCIERRDNARSFFPFGRRLFWWDDLDMAYFANYAFWNYLTLPARLMAPDVTVIQPRPDQLEVRYPDTVPTHCSRQVFHIDPITGLLRQHDYTPDIIGPFARAANIVLEHGTAGEVAYTSRRRVTPRSLGANALPGPVLISITVHEFSLE